MQQGKCCRRVFKHKDKNSKSCVALLDVNTLTEVKKKTLEKYPRRNGISKASGAKLGTKLVHLTYFRVFLSSAAVN